MMTNDRMKVVSLAQELAEALPGQMSRLGKAEDLLEDLIAFYDKSEAEAAKPEWSPETDLTEDFEEIVERARELIGKVSVSEASDKQTSIDPNVWREHYDKVGATFSLLRRAAKAIDSDMETAINRAPDSDMLHAWKKELAQAIESLMEAQAMLPTNKETDESL